MPSQSEQMALQDNANINYNQPAATQNHSGESDPSWLDKAGYAANGAMQGLSFGFADEIEGAMGGLGYGLASLNSDWNKRGESFWDAAKRGYVQTRDARRNHLQEGYEKAPVIIRTAEAIGASVSPINKIGQVSRFAPRSVQTANSMKRTTVGGTVYGYGSGEGEFSEQAKNATLGGMSGWAGNKVSQWSRPVTSAAFINQTTRNLANDFAGNVTGQVYQAGSDEMEDYWKRRRF